MQFNTLLENIKQNIANNNCKEAILDINLSQSKEYIFNDFLIKFNELYPDFTIKLMETYPQLTETDVRLCILIVSGLKSIKIANMFNVTEPTIGKYRNRLRKKLSLENNADIANYLLTKFIQ